LQSSPDDYFVSKENPIRRFLDNHYDNFYAYYFAGRSYDSRQRLLNLLPADRRDNRVLEMALQNISTLDGLYSVDCLDRLESDLKQQSPEPSTGSLRSLRVNTGDGYTLEERRDNLRALGATAATFERLEAMTRLDRIIWSHLKEAERAMKPPHAPDR
jgi:hypothetical protein